MRRLGLFEDFTFDDLAFDPNIDEFGYDFTNMDEFGFEIPEMNADAFDFSTPDLTDFGTDFGTDLSNTFDPSVFDVEDADMGAAMQANAGMDWFSSINPSQAFGTAATVGLKLLDLSASRDAQQTQLETARIMAGRNPSQLQTAMAPGQRSVYAPGSSNPNPLTMYRTTVPPGYKIDPKTGKVVPVDAWYKRPEVIAGGLGVLAALVAFSASRRKGKKS